MSIPTAGIQDAWWSQPDRPSDNAIADGSYTSPAWNDLVIYELHIGTFVLDKTLSKPGGTFDSAATKLDYLKSLGINAIEIMAAGEFETRHFVGIQPGLHLRNRGTIRRTERIPRVRRRAHKRGIAVIMDVVYNHLGYPAGDMWRFDGWSESDKVESTFITMQGAQLPGATPGFDYRPTRSTELPSR